MRAIPITQFLRPKGEKRPLVCDVSDDVASLARAGHRAVKAKKEGTLQFKILGPLQISGSDRAAFASASLPTCI